MNVPHGMILSQAQGELYLLLKKIIIALTSFPQCHVTCILLESEFSFDDNFSVQVVEFKCLNRDL
jgi:hypothetical protein